MKVDVELYQLIRYKYAVEGLSKRRIARELGISRHTVDKYCEGAAVPWERKRPERKAPVMTEEVVSFIAKCLRQDKDAPEKQRHTAHRIYERLREEMGFQGAEPTVRRQVAILRQKLPEAYVPLGFGPGEAAQVDWGRAVVVMVGSAAKWNRLTPLPAKPYDPARAHETVPNYFALVTFDGNQYSVPVELVGRTVTVKAYAGSVKIYHRGTMVAFHRRLYGKGKTAYELSHYLRFLERKPRAVFHAKPVREANLPGIYEEFARLSDSPERTMVRLLRLGVDYGLERVATAIEEAMAIGARSVEVVAHYLAKNEESPRLPVRGPRVDPPDLGRYDLLLGGGTR